MRHLIYMLGIFATVAGIIFNIINWMRTGDIDVTATTQKFSIFVFLKNVALFYYITSHFKKPIILCVSKGAFPNYLHPH